jgi:hypothetical protein
MWRHGLIGLPFTVWYVALGMKDIYIVPHYHVGIVFEHNSGMPNDTMGLPLSKWEFNAMPQTRMVGMQGLDNGAAMGAGC